MAARSALRQCIEAVHAAPCQKTYAAVADTSCANCPLRALPLFIAPEAGELALVQSLKRGERSLAAGETLIDEGQTDGPLFTLLRGWAFRFKTLSDGRRQILNILLAGDFIGVQQTPTPGSLAALLLAGGVATRRRRA